MAVATPPVLGFVAPSGSGKTTLLCRLLPLLRARGLRVGCLKHAHHRFDVDHPGKDSFELRAAGAEQVLVASRRRWALMVETPEADADPDLDTLLARLDPSGLDLVLVEGFKHADYAKIEVHRSALGLAPLYPEDPAIIAVASDRPSLTAPAPPRLALDDPEAIAGFVLEWLAGLGER
ncbi:MULTISPECIES: molybdopterin-guanine dinucleotide biosynthesis protein B [unclassified Marichromatium]|uniref:molybdopterin-guanine dinucleotide biosynthesis protein B n=1 Tax=unclassified Marichromatium TaxID=2618417 RepID=UPI000F417E0A|nr:MULTISPECIES: molybdopterin-guanine dinucleotide biosynthesis protein B [unclassified Marichromatium]RNE91046.1 molybdopterin-guanine dinucleotide biosynthesis protein B [Marichromatium sp. AB31]RNE93821.1 molybdopterin-guanine dinucleotide biosynthesis protein B [Marichromatium sp. AB32]